MYAETDFLLALIKDDDWLGDAAEAVYEAHADDLWTSQFTLAELLMVAYREDRDVERVVTNATSLVTVRGDETAIVAAATHVKEYGLTPFDAIHLVMADGDRIVSSDDSYDGLIPRRDLREYRPE
ncbi:type II toxin-antitoxin system VapC family toxin [Halococcoides cellulosivorans]|uniref:PIN domain-containing protein n=1 Tax=Halococcoides cellulosivorans TaxID=1679096 RepID=A0A2R4X2D9_9EURY|nr:PIN domain-containing protein [Halococcoides cellulosivorans]AWB27979.1 hypothetical protein HARCEL1_09800 [Halococcoides cellulosivorans]